MDLRPPDKGRHLGAITDLFAKAFSGYGEEFDYGSDGYLEGAPYDWAASRIGIVDGEVATHFGVWDFTMRIGTATARVAGIGAVATERTLSGRGLMTQTASDAVESFRDAGYDMSLLFGIQNYYLQFGYVDTFPEYIFSVSTRDVVPADPPEAFELFNGDYTDFADQYNGENEGVTGTFVRPSFTTNRRPKKWNGYIFDGGYLVTDRKDGVLGVADCAGPPDRVLEVARQLATREVAPTIEFTFLPRRSLMGEYLQTITHTYTAKFVRDGGPLIKVVNLESLMEKLTPELSRRLAGSPLATYSGRLAIGGDGENVTLVIQDGTVVAVEPAEAAPSAAPADGTVTAGPAIARLVIGDDDPHRICRQAGITVEGDAIHLVPILFPNEEPSTILWDRF